MKVTLKIKVGRMGVDTHVNGKGKKKVFAHVLEGFSRDHINIFPEDWAAGVMEIFFKSDRTGKVFMIEGETYSYTRKDGSKSVGIRNIRPAK